MKHIYLFLFLLITNLISAQDLRLFQNTWHLTKIVENGIDYFPPTNTEVQNILLNFNQQNSSMSTNVCNGKGGTVTFGNDFVSFSSHALYQTLIMCNLESDGDFESRYFLVFTSDTGFSYTISENGTVKTLTITNMINNKQAIYSSQNLSTADFKELNFSIYSNPLTDFVMVELKNQNTENTKVEIVDSSGKICKSNYSNSSQIKISTADLSSGVYIIKITVGNEVGIKKFVK